MIRNRSEGVATTTRRRILATRNAPGRQRFSAGFRLRHPTLPRSDVFVKQVVCRARATTSRRRYTLAPGGLTDYVSVFLVHMHFKPQTMEEKDG